jgi:hypothetical protein
MSTNSVKLRLVMALAGTMGFATAASAAHPPAATVSPAQIAVSHCVPGMTAATPATCSLPGFHWAYTIESTGHNSFDRPVWMLLPD